MSGTANQVDPQRAALYARVFNGDLGAAHVWFDQHVLDRYRGASGCRVMRTNTVGRLQSSQGWSLDFGIAEGEQLIHATAGDLSQRLPASDRLHWAQHVVSAPVSRTFVTMRLSPGSCIDDGDLRDFRAAEHN